jgi:hypothetical protein
MKQSVFIIGEIYSDKYINTNKGDSQLLRYGQQQGGVHAIHLMYYNYDIWFIMDKNVGYTGKNYYNYKCVFTE